MFVARLHRDPADPRHRAGAGGGVRRRDRGRAPLRWTGPVDLLGRADAFPPRIRQRRATSARWASKHVAHNASPRRTYVLAAVSLYPNRHRSRRVRGTTATARRSLVAPAVVENHVSSPVPIGTVGNVISVRVITVICGVIS